MNFKILSSLQNKKKIKGKERIILPKCNFNSLPKLKHFGTKIKICIKNVLICNNSFSLRSMEFNPPSLSPPLIVTMTACCRTSFLIFDLQSWPAGRCSSNERGVDALHRVSTFQIKFENGSFLTRNWRHFSFQFGYLLLENMKCANKLTQDFIC